MAVIIFQLGTSKNNLAEIWVCPQLLPLFLLGTVLPSTSPIEDAMIYAKWKEYVFEQYF